MPKSEFLDIVDRQGNIIGTATREKCHRNPKLIHQVAHCWLFNKKGQLLWQQRSLQKDEAPGLWDMSCGGHISHGEKPAETLKRELHEELGLENVNFHLVDKYIESQSNQTELIYLYYAIVNKTVNEFVIQKSEVQQVKWIDVHKAQMALLRKKVPATDFVISQVSRILQKVFLEQ